VKPRFQADNDLDQRIVVATRRLDPGIDFRTAAALGLHHVPDPEVLALAAAEGRVLQRWSFGCDLMLAACRRVR